MSSARDYVLHAARGLIGEEARRTASDLTSPTLYLLLEDERLERSDLAKSTWGFMTRDNVLTFFDQGDLEAAYWRLKQLEALTKMSLPDYMLDFNTLIELKNIIQAVYARLKRAYRGFERRLQAQRHVLVEYMERQQERKGFGFLGR